MRGSVTIAIPVFNGERYLADALQSVVDQTEKVDRIMICDNCSTDGTLDIANKFKEAHPEIQFDIVCNEANLGYQRNFNRCMELSKTDYVLLLAADDVLKENLIEIEKGFLEQNPEYAFVAAYSDSIDEEGEILLRHQKREDQFFQKGQILEFLQRNRLYIVPSAVLLRTSCIHDIGLWDHLIGPDERYWPKILQKYPIAILGDALVDRRDHADQTAVKDYEAKFSQVMLSLRENLKVADYESNSKRRAITKKLIKSQNSSSSLMMGNLVIKHYEAHWIGFKYLTYSIWQAPSIHKKIRQTMKATKIFLYGLSQSYRLKKLKRKAK